jgi:hypothetical protein
MPFVNMVFTYADYASSTPVNDTISVAQVRLGGNGLWHAAGVLAVKALVNKVREANRAILNCESSSTVFVHSSSDIKHWWSNIHDRPFKRPPDYDCPAILRGARLDPINILAVESNLRWPFNVNRICDDQG